MKNFKKTTNPRNESQIVKKERTVSPKGVWLYHPRVIEYLLIAQVAKEKTSVSIKILQIPKNQSFKERFSHLANEAGVRIEEGEKLSALSYLKEPRSQGEFYDALKKKHIKKAVFLDGVTDVGNLGAIARSSFAMGVDALLIPKHDSGTLSTDAIKASAGALALLPLYEINSPASLLSRVKESKFWILGSDSQQRGGKSLLEYKNPPEKWVLVMGGEHDGMRRSVREACDEILAIPMSGNFDSLNVSVSLGIMLYAINNASQKARL